MAPTLYFIRHGETSWNAEFRLQGQRDIQLNDKGRGQAAESGRLLLSALKKPDSLPWLVSPLGRTRETAELARGAIGLPSTHYAMDERLKELTFGDWEGRTWAELRQIDSAAVDARFADKYGYAPPDGESYAMLQRRVSGWLDSIESDSVVVSHGGVARVLMVLRTGLGTEIATDADVHQGRVLIFRGDTAEWI